MTVLRNAAAIVLCIGLAAVVLAPFAWRIFDDALDDDDRFWDVDV
jgi:hypothetical protein